MTRNHNLHGKHKSPTNSEVEQYNKAAFNQPSFETKLCPTRPTVARNHKLHGGHKKSLTNLQVVQYNNIRGADIPKKRGMQRRQRVGGGALVVKQPSSSHVVHSIVRRRPGLGLTPKSEGVPNTHVRRKLEGYPCRGCKHRCQEHVDMQGWCQSAAM